MNIRCICTYIYIYIYIFVSIYITTNKNKNKQPTNLVRFRNVEENLRMKTNGMGLMKLSFGGWESKGPNPP